jgi:hypothetical protein
MTSIPIGNSLLKKFFFIDRFIQLNSRNSQRSSSLKHSRHESSSNRYYHTSQSHRHTFDTSSTMSQSNENDFDTINKKRKHYHTDNDRHNDHRSSKKHRRSSPSTIYSSHHHRPRSPKHRRRSSSSSRSTRSSDNKQYSPAHEHQNNQHAKLTKGTLGSELDKLRPKTSKNKSASVPDNQSQSDQIQTNDNDVS